jgi:type I restriction enzyme M protein
MFVSSVKFVERHNGSRSSISVRGQERNPDTWRLAKMNLAIRGIAHNLGERPESTFAEDLHKYEKVDFIMADGRGIQGCAGTMPPLF